MGFIINDTITTSSGVEIKGAYAAIRSQRLVIHGSSNPGKQKVYTVQGTYAVYKDKQCSLSNMQPLETKPVKKTLTSSQLNEIFPQVYAAAKANYQSTTDD